MDIDQAAPGGGPAAARRTGALRLRALGQRATEIRLDVLQVLGAGDDHLSVPEIHRRITEQRPATRASVSAVYRTIDRLAALDLVHGSPTEVGTAWGLALDGHSHITCTRCGRRVSLATDVVRDLLDRLTDATGIVATSVDAHGTCQSCQLHPLTR